MFVIAAISLKIIEIDQVIKTTRLCQSIIKLPLRGVSSEHYNLNRRNNNQT